jgi:hypothetical protein
MNEFSFFENTNALSQQLAKKRGSPLNFFLAPYIERYMKRLEAQIGMTQLGASASPLAPNPLAEAIRGGMPGGTDMETPSF